MHIEYTNKPSKPTLVAAIRKAPLLRRYIVTVNYRDEVEVMASSEDNAIDRVLMDTSYDVRVMNCNDLEVRI